ncbi:unnamed protein product [Boreogadus saida]
MTSPNPVAMTSPLRSPMTSPSSRTMTSPSSRTMTSPSPVTMTSPLRSPMTSPSSRTMTSPISRPMTSPLRSPMTSPSSRAMTSPSSRPMSSPCSSTSPRPVSSLGIRPFSAGSDPSEGGDAGASSLTHGAGNILFCGNPVQALRARRENLRVRAVDQSHSKHITTRNPTTMALTAPSSPCGPPGRLPLHVSEPPSDPAEPRPEGPGVGDRSDVLEDLRAWRRQHAKRLQLIEKDRQPEVLKVNHSDEDCDDVEEEDDDDDDLGVSNTDESSEECEADEEERRDKGRQPASPDSSFAVRAPNTETEAPPCHGRDPGSLGGPPAAGAASSGGRDPQERPRAVGPHGPPRAPEAPDRTGTPNQPVRGYKAPVQSDGYINGPPRNRKTPVRTRQYRGKNSKRRATESAPALRAQAQQGEPSPRLMSPGLALAVGHFVAHPGWSLCRTSASPAATATTAIRLFRTSFYRVFF